MHLYNYCQDYWCHVVRLIQKCWEPLLVVPQLSCLSSVLPNFKATNTWTLRTDKPGQVTNFAAVPSAEAVCQTGMLRGEKKKFSWFSGIFVVLLQCFGSNEAFSPQTIWAKGCLCLCTVLVTLGWVLKVQGSSLLPLDFDRKTQMLSSTRDPNAEFQHRLQVPAWHLVALCTGNGMWMDLAVRNLVVAFLAFGHQLQQKQLWEPEQDSPVPSEMLGCIVHTSLGLSYLSRFFVLMKFSSDSNLQKLWGNFVFLCSKRKFSFSHVPAVCCSLSAKTTWPEWEV